jgi:uncharacterized membrane protein
MKYIPAFLATAVVFGALDALWLGVIMKDFYRSQLGGLLLAKPNLLPALIFYAIYILGVVIFSVIPALQSASWTRAALLGAFLGLVAYSTYDLTNLATLEGWKMTVVFVDIIWGVFATSIAATFGYLTQRTLVDSRTLTWQAVCSDCSNELSPSIEIFESHTLGRRLRSPR